MSGGAGTTHAQPLVAGSGLGRDPDWRAALGAALDGAQGPLGAAPPDLLLLFANQAFVSDYGELLRAAADRTGALEIAGCSGSGVIGVDHEVEGEPAVAALALRLPAGARIGLRHVDQDEVAAAAASGPEAAGWPGLLGVRSAACTGLVALADPFSVHPEMLIAGLAHAYPQAPLVGGLASGSPTAQRTHLFAGTRVFEAGAVVVALSGSVALRAVVSQGCEPIGEPWTITGVRDHLVETIGNRPAYTVLVEMLQALEASERRRAVRNLLIGLAMDEYRHEFRRGDFLIRNVLGVDPSSGAIAIGAHPRVGQTLQFQVRDARAADEELRHLLGQAADELEERPAAVLLFACNGRGQGLFGRPDHDVQAARQLLVQPPVAGLFCNGEIGPVGAGTFLHGFTASLGLLVPRSTADPADPSHP